MNRLGRTVMAGMLGLLTALAVPAALPAFQAQAAGFKPTAADFRPAFDFDTVPDTRYQTGDQPGSTTDMVGLSKNKKCILATGVGLSYNLKIVGSGGYSGKALELDVSALAPADGAWSPVDFHLDFGNHAAQDFTGATDFIFWVDTTRYKDGTQNKKGILMYIQETDCNAAGQIPTDKTQLKSTAWKPKLQGEGGFYLKEDGKGGWIKVPTEKDDVGFYLPASYKGWIRIPISAFKHVDWSKDDADNKFDLKQIQLFEFGMGNYATQAGSIIIFDQLGFYGKFQAASTGVSSKAGGGTTTPASSAASAAGTGSTASAASNAASGVGSSLAASDISIAAGLSGPESAISAAQSASGTSGAAKGRGGALPVIIAGVAVAVAALGVGVFFAFKNGLVAKLFHK